MRKGTGSTEEEVRSIPDGADLGLGCGNPTALASLAEGEIVLDLGSGGGFDCFLAARLVGAGGRLTGVDMTPEMIEKGREVDRRGNTRSPRGGPGCRLIDIERHPLRGKTGMKETSGRPRESHDKEITVTNPLAR